MNGLRVIIFILIFAGRVTSQEGTGGGESELENGGDNENVEESSSGTDAGQVEESSSDSSHVDETSGSGDEGKVDGSGGDDGGKEKNSDQETDVVATVSTPTPAKIDYAKLDMSTNLLKGSRWSIEQKKMKKKIDVFHAIEIVDISKVDVDQMSIRIEIHMQQRWEAEDMKLPQGLFEEDDPVDVFIQADPAILQSLWSPNSYIPTARDTKIASFTEEQSVVHIFRNKTIVYKARLFTILGCLFDFQWYPLDKQICSLSIESYTATDALVSYVWETMQSPVVYSNLKLLQYDLHVPMRYSNGSYRRWGRGEVYPYVELFFEFERQLGHHIIQVFIPTTLVVILSWFSFWLGLDAVPGRITLLITAMLTLVTMHTGLKGSIPPVNYIKMMDIWMVGCMTFVFLALCEFVIVKFMHWKNLQELKAAAEKEKEMEIWRKEVKEMDERNKGKIDRIDKTNPYLHFYKNMVLRERIVAEIGIPRPAWEGHCASWGPSVGGNQNNPQQNKTKRPAWVKVDRVSRVLFPLSFAIFNAVFWPYLLIGADNQ